jgi:hypothetical protein
MMVQEMIHRRPGNPSELFLRDSGSRGVCLADNRTTRVVRKTKTNNPMKANQLVLAATLFTSLTTLSWAGPSPQFWTELARSQEAKQAKAVPAATPAKETAACTTCACCANAKQV